VVATQNIANVEGAGGHHHHHHDGGGGIEAATSSSDSNVADSLFNPPSNTISANSQDNTDATTLNLLA
jgi:hypothetical protein